jgi:sugar phosphate isomerase/epimerase
VGRLKVSRAVYLSSSCVAGRRIGEVVKEIARSGITNIELSGGTEYYDSIEEDLLTLKEKYGLGYLVHGYFPPPEEDFIINLVSGRERAFNFFRETIKLSKTLGCDMYSTHAGFTVDVLPLTRGEQLSGQPPMVKRAAEEILYNNIQSVMEDIVGPDFRFAVENMYPLMGREDYSLVTSPEEILRFLDYSRQWPNLGMLLDLGHLNLAASVADFDRIKFVRGVLENYADKVFEIHISENDGTGDTHDIPAEDSWQLEVAGWEALRDVPVTFEWRGVDGAEAFRCYREFLRSPVFA